MLKRRTHLGCLEKRNCSLQVGYVDLVGISGLSIVNLNMLEKDYTMLSVSKDGAARATKLIVGL
jgi:hypothetical protein